jgi:heme-degrading monooxygenase HmoA
MLARFGWADIDAATVETVVDAYRSRTLPEISAKDGYTGTFLAFDRNAGRMVGVTVWRDEEALLAHERDEARHIAQVREASGAGEPTIEHYEVVLWHVADAGDAGAM